MNVSRRDASHFGDAVNTLNIPPGEYGRKIKTQRNPLTLEEAPANSVPAAAVIRRVQALLGITGRKARAGGLISWK